IWIAAPIALYVEPTLFGLLAAPTEGASFFSNLALVWWVLGVSAVLFRTVQLFFLKGGQSGMVWCTQILTDPFHDIKVYHKAPYYLLKGDMYDNMSEWYDDSIRVRMG